MTTDNTNEMVEHGGVVMSTKSVSTAATVGTQFRINSPPSLNTVSSDLGSSSQDTMLTDSPTRMNASSLTRRDSTAVKSNKSLPSSSKTPRSSSVTGFHNRNFRIRTCCGILELNCLKLTSFTALIVSLLAFAALIVIIAINYSVVSTYHTKLESLETAGTFSGS